MSNKCLLFERVVVILFLKDLLKTFLNFSQGKMEVNDFYLVLFLGIQYLKGEEMIYTQM